METTLHKSNKSHYIQLVTMILLTLATQVVMLLKTSITAAQFGATLEMDAFNFANSIGTFIFSFIGSGITTVIIPNLLNEEKKESINIFISILYSVSFILVFIIFMFRRSITITLSSGNEEFIRVVSNIMFITLSTQFISSFSGVTNAIFQCNGKFNLPKITNLLISIILLFLVFLSSNLNIYKYAFYMFITTLINILYQFYIIFKDGYTFKYKIDFKDAGFKNMITIFAPTVLSTGLYQVSLITDSIIASNLGEGKISILSYSNNIMQLINSLLLTNIMIYFYPKIAKKINDKDSQQRLMDLSILINMIMVLILVGFIVVGREGISILYERGAFTSQIGTIVYYCTVIYILSLPSNAIRDLIYRYFYAKQDTKTPFKNSLRISILNIIISIILSIKIGIYGVIIGTVVTSYISLTLITLKFNQKFNSEYNKKNIKKEQLKIILIGLITIVVVTLIKMFFKDLSTLFSLVFFGSMTVIVYFILLVAFKSKALKIKL